MGRMPFTKPLVVSLCGTFLKPEMLSVYRQIAGLRRHRTVVFTERRLHPEQFPFEPVVVMEKPPPAVRAKRRKKQRPRGNFIRRFWYKHLLKQWPPPERPPRVDAPPPPPPPVYDDNYNLCDLLRERQPQLVHVYYGHKAVKYLPMLRRWGGPLVVSFHGVDVTDAVYRDSAAGKLAGVFAHARLILGRSRSLLEQLAALGCPPEKLRLNRTPVPLDGIPRAVRQPPDDDRWRLVQACRLIPKKGLRTTLQALRIVADAWPGVVLTLAGDGPLGDEMRALTAALGLERNVVFAGWCAQDRLLALYRDAHLFLHPSEMTEAGDREGIPNSLLEGMAAGLPAVATWHGGIPEAVTDGGNGLLVPEKSPGELAAAVLRLMSDPALLERLSREAGASMDAHFGAARQIAALEDCYEEAIRP